MHAPGNPMTFRRLTNLLHPSGGTSLPSARGSAPGVPLSRTPIAGTLAAIAILFVGIGSGPANAENPDISSRRASERVDFNDDEIRDGFFKIAFSAELQLDAPVERVRKFDEPVRIFVVSKGLPDRRSRW